jgi:predicted esterase
LANAYNLVTCYAFQGQPEKAIQALQYGLDHGIWYGTWDFEADLWEPVKTLGAFQTIQARSQACLADAQAQAKPELTVATPQGFDPSQVYPLFIALHGGGETVQDFQPHWTSPRLQSEFILALPQSGRVVSMTGFSWLGEEQDRRELAAHWENLQADYRIDSNRVLVGGFSAGGHQAISLLLDEVQTVPARGFIALCPPLPQNGTPEAAARMANRGQRGALFTTEMDGRVAAQRELAAILQAAGFPLRFEVTPDLGHWYPPDLPEKIDRAIDFILNP